MAPHPYSALATLIVLVVFLWTLALVARARARHGVVAPAVTGHEIFERCFRVQMNTLEQMILLLPALWLCAFWVGDLYAGLGGLIWSLGRVLYGLGYVQEPRKRATGFYMTIAPTAIMVVADAVAVVNFLLS